MIFDIKNKDIEIRDNFIYLTGDDKASYIEKCLGMPEGFVEFTAVHRNSVFFQSVTAGKKISDIPKETQWLLLSHDDGTYSVIVPIVAEPFRSALYGSDEGIVLYSETGDDAIAEKTALSAYAARGEDPYTLMEKAAEEIAAVLPECGLRRNKKMPEFMNYFGWCTWDSFYEKVSAEDVRRGLESFKKGGVVPGLLILDDGWQSVCEVSPDRGLHQLSSFLPNEKFGHNLHETVDMAKNEFGVRMFMVWHAIMGYWGGTYPKSPEMEKYNVKLKTQNHSKAMYEVNYEYSKNLHFPYGFIDPDKAFDFYNDYHSYLRKEGVDGVKVDVQSAIEAVGYGEGGRVKTVKAFRRGLEASVNVNFGGNLINCMSCSNDHILNALTGSVFRSSDDFFPSKPESQGVHIITNAFVSMYMGDFLTCDWDMFQTEHEYGKFHAATRAISGGPVYVSDRVDEHDFEVIRKLTMADSKLCLCQRNARPAKDSLFIDGKDPKELFKIFNYNKYNGVIGVINLTKDRKMEKAVRVSDINGFSGGEWAVYDMASDNIKKLADNEETVCSLDPISVDIYTVCKVEEGFAPIGLRDKYNAGGAILFADRNDNNISLITGDGGEFIAYSENEPERVSVNGKRAEYSYADKTLTVDLPEKKENKIFIVL